MDARTELLSLLVCPVCQSRLHPVDNMTGLACDTCAVVYPVENDIPILLSDEAIPASSWKETHQPA